MSNDSYYLFLTFDIADITSLFDMFYLPIP
jgi:hypothetical protein